MRSETDRRLIKSLFYSRSIVELNQHKSSLMMSKDHTTFDLRVFRNTLSSSLCEKSVNVVKNNG